MRLISLFTKNWTGWVWFTPRIAQEPFYCATGLKAFHAFCEGFWKLYCIDFVTGWTTLVKAESWLLKLLENNAFNSTHRREQLSKQRGVMSVLKENYWERLNDQEVNAVLPSAKEITIQLNSVFHFWAQALCISAYILQWCCKAPAMYFTTIQPLDKNNSSHPK